jgi:hypothetical protein
MTKINARACVAFLSIPLGLGIAVTPTLAQSSVSSGEIEAFLGLTSGALSGLGNGDATEGSAIKQTFSGTAGETLTFDWNFFTNEATPSFFNDFSFITLSPSGGTSTLADTNSRFPLLGSNVSFNSETGFNTFSFILPEDATYTLGLGIVDVGDTVVGSALLVDNLNLGTNGGFEAGDFSGWETIGATSVTDSSFGVDPTEGELQALLTTESVPVVPEPTSILGTGFVLACGVLLKRKSSRLNRKLSSQ